MLALIVNKLWLLLASLIIITAIVFTLLRVLLPHLNYFKQDIENWVENSYGINISFDQIEGEWAASGPVLSFNNIALQASGGQLNLVEVKQLSIYVDGISSILAGQLVTEDIHIDGASLSFILGRKLGVRLDTIEPKEQVEQYSTDLQNTSNQFLRSLFAQKKLTVTHSNLLLETLSGRQFAYDLDELSIRNYDQIHQLTGRLVDKTNGVIKLVAEIYGNPSSDDSYTNLYMEGKNIDIAKLPVLLENPRLKPEKGLLSWRLWTEWRNNRWQQALGDMEIAELDWHDEITGKNDTNTSQSILKLEKISNRFSWDFLSDNNGIFKLYDLNLRKNESEITSLPEAYLLFEQKESLVTWDFVLQKLQVDDLTGYLDLLIGETVKSQKRISSGISMQLSQFGIRLHRKNHRWESPALVANFSDLSYEKIMGIPVVKGFSGELSFINDIGSARLYGSNVSLDFDKLFRKPIQVDDIDLRFNWSGDNERRLNLNVEYLKAKNSDLAIKASARFFFQDGKPVLSLFSELNDLNAASKSLYLPVGIMSNGLVEYLDRSVKTGTLPYVKAVVHGPLESFPFDNTDGVFSIFGQLDNARFEYLPEWPAVENLNAELLFEGNGMDLKALAAQAGGNTVNTARAVIKDFSEENTPFELFVDATVKDNLGVDYLSETPIKDVVEGLGTIDFQGRAKAKIDMSFGLEDPSNLVIDGSIKLSKGESAIKVDALIVDNIDGSVDFNEKGIKPSILKARLAGEPLKVQVSQKVIEGDKEEKIVNIRADGRLNSQLLASYAGERIGAYIRGSSDLDIQINAGSGQNKGALVEVKSSLNGLAFDFPGIFAKGKEETSPIKLVVESKAEKSIAHLNWSRLKGKWSLPELKNRLQAVQSETSEPLGKQSKSPKGGVFYFGLDKKLPQSMPEGIVVEGKLNEIIFSEWKEFLDGVYQPDARSKTLNVSQQEPRFALNVSANQLKFEFMTLNEVELALHQPQSSQWVVGVHTREGSAIARIGKNETIEVEASNVNLPIPLNFSEKQTVNSTQEIIEEDSKTTLESWELIENWPSVDLLCASCAIDNKLLGDLKFKLRNQDGLLSLRGSAIAPNQHNLLLSLLWKQNLGVLSDSENAAQRESNTIAELQISSTNVGALMKAWNYPVGIEESNGALVANVEWGDFPWKFQPKLLKGGASFHFGKGYLSDVSDAKARIFSLFNLQSLSRRLRLDFKDVYKKGFFYEKLTGDISLDEGVISTDNVFVDGSAAKVSLSGHVDLNKDIIEQNALVIPQLTSSLPVLVGWAVEPTTGLLVYLVNKIMEPAIDVVTQIEYRIHGNLGDINVDEVKKVSSKVKYEVEEDDTDTDETKSTNEDSSEDLSTQEPAASETDNKNKSKVTSETEVDRSLKQELSANQDEVIEQELKSRQSADSSVSQEEQIDDEKQE
nr:YhdP family protein [Aliikangiella sp. G2MR2-5]